MTSAIFNYLHLPPRCVLEQARIIPKTVLTRQMKLTARQKRLLTTVEQLKLAGTLTHANTGMPAHIDAAYDVQSVLVLTLELRENRNATELIELIHRAFPHPTILLAKQATQALVSVAVPRKSLAEHEATVIDLQTHTEWFNPISPDSRGLRPKLAYEAQSHADLLAYALGFSQNLLFWNLREWLGDDISIAPLRQAEIREPLLRLNALHAEIRQLRALRKNRDTPLRESTRLRMQEHRLAQDATALAARIKEH